MKSIVDDSGSGGGVMRLLKFQLSLHNKSCLSFDCIWFLRNVPVLSFSLYNGFHLSQKQVFYKLLFLVFKTCFGLGKHSLKVDYLTNKPICGIGAKIPKLISNVTLTNDAWILIPTFPIPSFCPLNVINWP